MPAEAKKSKKKAEAAEEPVVPEEPAPEEDSTETDAKHLVQAEAEELAKYDLTAKMTPFLDRHLIFPILQFLQELGVYRPVDVTRAELQLLAETKMIDYAIDHYASLGEEAPESLKEKRSEVLKDLTDSQHAVMPLLLILEDEQKVEKIGKFTSLSELLDSFKLEAISLDNMLHYAKLEFECGNYNKSCELLKHYRSIMSVGNERPTKYVNAIWGSLASFILIRQFDKAFDLIFELAEILEGSKSMSKREVLLQRTWLLHWTLWIVFKAEKLVDPKILTEFFLNEKSLSIISLSCPHLFRYVGACLILHKRVRVLLKETAWKEIVWIIHHEAGSYADPITRFLLALYMDMDFDEAQRELQLCAVVCKGDYFLSQHWAEFEENARLLIFETYCRIHQCINIRMIASKLNMEAEEAELWIVKLIQNAKLDARIDSEKSRVVMSKAPPSVYQQVIEKTKNLSFRSTMLLSNLEKREKERLTAA